MKLLLLICSFLATFCGPAQTTAANHVDSVKDDLKKLWYEAQDAALKRVRAAPERIYGDEFIVIQASGKVNY